MNYTINFAEEELVIMLQALQQYMYSSKITNTQFEIANSCTDKIDEVIE